MSPLSETKTLDQQRAVHAWNVVQTVKTTPDAKAKEFGGNTKKLPTRIIAAGLGQALAFLQAKDLAAPLRNALSDWIKQRRPNGNGKEETLLHRIIHGDADFQRYATAECLAYLVWLVRFADAEGLTKEANTDRLLEK